MNRQLAETLINKGIMKPGTLIYGKTEAASLGQVMQMVPMELMMEDFDGEVFACRDRLGKTYTMHVDNVQEVDGMEPGRLASVYNIKPDGGSKTVGKKRGRKPKSTHINTMEGESHGQDKRTSNQDQVEPISP